MIGNAPRSVEQQRAIEQWKYNNRAAIAKLPRELAIDPNMVRKTIDGQWTTRTLQLERKLAQMKCPTFEQYAEEQKQEEIGQ